jgi:hypothetical protein
MPDVLPERQEKDMSIESHVAALRSKHEEIDLEILDLERSPSTDSVAIHDAKRRKLALKDQIEEFSRTH